MTESQRNQPNTPPETGSADLEAVRRRLVERVAASRYISRSARMRELLVYLTDRVLEGPAREIHEQEVGHQVFGRAPDYDTATDNIVRVNASVLRKRLEQYFSSEGSGEPVMIEIPKGNYAPVFRERAPAGAAPPAPRSGNRLVGILAALLTVFAVSTLALLVTRPRSGGPDSLLKEKPTVRLFWSQVLRGGEPANLVLDDAAVGLFQEITGEPLTLSRYFDRSYLRQLDQAAARARLDPRIATAIVLRRHTSYAGSGLAWRLSQIAGSLDRQVSVQFARDFSFRGLKSGNTILLGHSRTNPWVEPFEAHTGLRWEYQPDQGISFPVDTWANRDPKRYSVALEPAERQGYAMIAHLPNLAGNGSVLIIAGTGGSAIGAAGEFLADEPSVARLMAALPKSRPGAFPYFEALLQTRGRSSLPKDVSIVISRSPRL